MILQIFRSNFSYENDPSFASFFHEEHAHIYQTIHKDFDRHTVTIDRHLLEEMAFHLRDAPYDGVDNYTRIMTALLGLKELKGVEPLVPGMSRVINDVSSFEYPIAIAPCRGKFSNHRSLFIAVISAPRNFERRATIRRTWPLHLKNQTNSNKPLDVVGFSFVVGLTKDDVIQQKLMEEHERHRDMLQVNMYDKYRNLSLKVTGLLNWVHRYCPQVDFVLKVDDDVYVNVHNLATVLHSHPPSERSVYGRKCGGGTVSERTPRNDSKWVIFYENWPWRDIPHYYQGAGIVMAGSAVRPLLAAIQTTPYFIWDDMYLIGLCAVKARLRIRTSQSIFVDWPENYADPCLVRNTVTWTLKSSEQMDAPHFVTHNLYRNSNVSRCIARTFDLGPNQTLVNQLESTINETAIAFEFPFGFMEQILTYHSFNPIFASDKSRTIVLLHSSASQGMRMADSIEENSNKSAITIDRKLFDYLKSHLSGTAYDGVDNYIRLMTVGLGLKELTNVKPLMPNMGPVINDVTSFEYPITVATCGQKMKTTRSVFVSIMSSPNHFEKRSTIRQTWANHLKNQSKVNKQLDVMGFTFVVGLTKDKIVQKKMMDESEQHGDMLQVNVYEEQANVSVKAAGLLNWVNMNCPQTDYLLKVDDDVYVNVHNLATVLYAFSPFVRSVYGRLADGAIPKWNNSEWPWTRMPTYLEGGGVVIAGSAVRSLLAAMQTTPYFIKDDIYLTGLCAEKARLQMRTSPRIFADQSEMYPNPCFVRGNVMWSSKSEDHVLTSHFVTESFYRNATNARCVLTTYVLNPNDTLGVFVDRTINTPAVVSEFHFKPVIHKKWVSIFTSTKPSARKTIANKMSLIS
ncbi:uncharacterized protein LOC130693163 [Daphnia carinata]|uniref:uncharacterized protein LOC130693163 n=1 Tax=Daphnia carinata TaxID=120202 RepID=UPI0028693F40|nr:uncharacterized protein LOC130693163 [Daphnia carinata]